MIQYKTSSFCSLGNCVEVGRTPDGRVAVRDSKERDLQAFVFTGEEWREFVAGVRNGEFDPA